ncbi:MAG: GFA family protein, partial [Myxococcota bacterium]
MIYGSCLCGSIRYETDVTVGPLGHCHCQMCRKAHGSAFSSIVASDRSGFRWSAGES